jgi:hypothetical protein
MRVLPVCQHGSDVMRSFHAGLKYVKSARGDSFPFQSLGDAEFGAMSVHDFCEIRYLVGTRVLCHPLVALLYFSTHR